ncbi:HAMP domain-containing sensor histidine kinase [Anaerosporobacter faecicola]|uniref:HAMP domain-containing sensor histidine kinase n=1 Tax=Anaerosporobacter faecicola TaxID=2718714 RepID=UPI00143B692E|nr:HAMP domain-containing sensor histidine kinase [Anaerosporobacter faecicola]
MRRRLQRITTVFALGLLAILFVMVLKIQDYETTNQNTTNTEEQLLRLNELEQLAKQAIEEQNQDVANEFYTSIANERKFIKSTEQQDKVERDKIAWMIVGGICIACLYMMNLYIDRAILRPFEKMKQYTSMIARGEFDLPLNYERSNYFGEFTWSFDEMRCEVTRARASEQEAIENNKTIIATLSHDIKTPIASIRAYAEALEANFDDSPEKRAVYTRVIMNKCDEVSALTEDLLLHFLSDLDKLQIQPQKYDIIKVLEETIKELSSDKEDIHLEKKMDKCLVSLDRKRFVQIVENIVGNARKYAKTDVWITVTEDAGEVQLGFRDHGLGIPEEELPFVTNKFYRGSNQGMENGAGLGLYIVSYIVDRMNGRILLQNKEPGLEVKITFPCC